jgi:hypothetical protein
MELSRLGIRCARYKKPRRINLRGVTQTPLDSAEECTLA